MKAARERASERWQHVELPDCTPLLAGADERGLCEAAKSAAQAARHAVERGASPGELCPVLGAAALSAQRASQALRAAGMRRLLDDRNAAAASASASAASGKKPPAPPRGHHHGHADAADATPVRVQKNPDLDAIGAYARAATLALRELGTILELGPLPVREGAFTELSRLVREEPHWAGLRALVTEAALVEANPALKDRLRRLKAQLGD